jgi:hypothetical protein
MTQEQATEIREYLIDQLNVNGFGNVVAEVFTRLGEDYEEKEFEATPHFLLSFFLAESIDILENLSNTNFDDLLNKLNKFSSGDNKVESISVELLNQGEPVYYDLVDLPDYKGIIKTFQNILSEIRNEN